MDVETKNSNVRNKTLGLFQIFNISKVDLGKRTGKFHAIFYFSRTFQKTVLWIPTFFLESQGLYGGPFLTESFFYGLVRAISNDS